ncbi:MAG: hypothetical protein QOJ35_2638 [Solirubrobacteraceae bacterium]|nr:hypothetical protein [Solirubrobacteraceae bacterium]
MLAMNSASPSQQAPAAAQRGGALRALAIGADARYRDRVEEVVGELGSVAFAHAAPSDPHDVWSLVEQVRANVVVLDATGCEAAVARVVGALSSLAPRLGVVVVCEHLTEAACELQALPKWGWRRELRAAVQRAQVDGSPLARRGGLSHGARRDLRGVAPASLGRR